MSAATEWLLPAGLVLALDQASKALVLARIGDSPRSPAGPGPRIRRVSHSPIGLGLVRDGRVLILPWAVAVVGAILLSHSVKPFEGQVAHLGLGAALGGATSNLLDTLRRGVVVDFIDLRIWPVFNIADAAIVLGITVALGSAVGSVAVM